MSRVVDGLQGEYREEEDPAQGHGHDHGRGQQVHPFWSEEVQEEHLLAQARPRGLPDETLSENLLELDLDEDELRTAGESTPPSWEPLENQGRSQSDAVGSQSVQDGLRVLRPEGLQRSSSDGVSRDSRLQSLLEADMGRRWNWRAAKGCQHGATWTSRTCWTRTGSWTSSRL